MTDEVVTRLYRALTEELRRRDHPEGSPIKVSEVYQTLVPYRAVRSALGVELNADYEHALLRLLAGERDLLRLEPSEAREELRREVDAPYPFVGLFRKFSASSVWVKMPEAPAKAAEPQEEASSESFAEPIEASATAPTAAPEPSVTTGTPAAQPAPGRPVEPAPVERAPRIAAEGETVRLSSGGGADPAPARPAVQLHPRPEVAPSERLTHAGAECAFCGEDLPSGRRVRFCPHCGGDQRLRPCPRCEAVLESDWRYCISCGNEVARE